LISCAWPLAPPTILPNFYPKPLGGGAQGAVCTGIWVIAHECGHGAFSEYPAVNDGVGLVFHSLLLVPYYSW